MTPEKVHKIISERDRLGRLLGIELLETGEGTATTRLTITEAHLNAADTAHGGAVFTLADVALAAASNAYGTIALLTNGSITLFRATAAGETLIATAREIGASRKLAHYRIDVENEVGEPVAVFNATVYRTGKPLAD